MAEETEAIEVKAEVDEGKATTTALTVSPEAGPVARPVVTPAQACAIVREWEELKSACLDQVKDVYRESKNGVEMAYIKKSGWRKMATFFGLRAEAVGGTERIQVIKTMRYGKPMDATICSVTYRATAPNGRYTDGDGHCGNDEGGKTNWTIANLLATAHTRAYNRAVSNLVGGGEVSAEEMQEEAKEESAKTKPQTQTQQHNHSSNNTAYWDTQARNAIDAISQKSNMNEVDRVMATVDERVKPHIPEALYAQIVEAADIAKRAFAKSSIPSDEVTNV